MARANLQNKDTTEDGRPAGNGQDSEAIWRGIEFSINGSRTNGSAIEDYTSAVEDTDINVLGGRPKGSTNCSICDVNHRIQLAKSKAAKAYGRALDKKKGSVSSSSEHYVRLSIGKLSDQH